jgi:hypothetical protein
MIINAYVLFLVFYLLANFLRLQSNFDTQVFPLPPGIHSYLFFITWMYQDDWRQCRKKQDRWGDDFVQIKRNLRMLLHKCCTWSYNTHRVWIIRVESEQYCEKPKSDHKLRFNNVLLWGYGICLSLFSYLAYTMAVKDTYPYTHGWIAKPVYVVKLFVCVQKNLEFKSEVLAIWDTITTSLQLNDYIGWLVQFLTYANEMVSTTLESPLLLDHAFWAFISTFPLFLHFGSLLLASADKWLLLHHWLISVTKYMQCKVCQIVPR